MYDTILLTGSFGLFFLPDVHFGCWKDRRIKWRFPR